MICLNWIVEKIFNVYLDVGCFFLVVGSGFCVCCVGKLLIKLWWIKCRKVW